MTFILMPSMTESVDVKKTIYMMDLKFKPHPDYEGRAKLTLAHYDLVDVIMNGDQRYAAKGLKKKIDRVCLFCGKRKPETNFKSEAHLVSNHIGNTHLFSDFECHTCNLKFGKLEDDLAKFLGISKALAKLDSKKPEGFRGKFLSAHSRTFMGEWFLILAPKDIKHEGNKTFIRYIKNPYTPVNVYKSLLKFALSILPGDEVNQHFPKALDFLAGKLHANMGAALSRYMLPFDRTLPLYMMVFKKRKKEDPLPTYMISFYFGNNIITLPILLHEKDVFWNDEIEIVLPPPYFLHEQYLQEPVFDYGVKDFASPNKVIDEEDEIIIALPEDYKENLTAYDPVTDTTTLRSFDGTPIKHITIMKEGVSVDPKALSAFIKEVMLERPV